MAAAPRDSRKTKPEKSRTEIRKRGPAAAPTARKRCNNLDGKRWLQNSISVWSDIKKTPEEARLGHPALFPQMLVERLIETFLPESGRVILDPFAGSGSTLVARSWKTHRSRKKREIGTRHDASSSPHSSGWASRWAR